MLTCPVCELPLARGERVWRCPRGHSFDRAREGYVYLTSSRQPGDTRDMLRARRAFLERGHYAPLAEALSALAVAHYAALSPGKRLLGTLDAGCGEGYYIGRVQRALAAQASTGYGEQASTGRPYDSEAPPCFGLDVSRDAARLAAKRYPAVTIVVADVRGRLPFASASLGLLLDVFAPRNPAEFARVLAHGGVLLVVIPAPEHLAELRAALPLLGIEAEKQQQVERRLAAAGFALRETRVLELALRPDAADLAALLAMTPNAWHADVATLAARVSACDPTMAITAAFRVLVFARTGSMV